MFTELASAKTLVSAALQKQGFRLTLASDLRHFSCLANNFFWQQHSHKRQLIYILPIVYSKPLQDCMQSLIMCILGCIMYDNIIRDILHSLYTSECCSNSKMLILLTGQWYYEDQPSVSLLYVPLCSSNEVISQDCGESSCLFGNHVAL